MAEQEQNLGFNTGRLTGSRSNSWSKKIGAAAGDGGQQLGAAFSSRCQAAGSRGVQEGGEHTLLHLEKEREGMASLFWPPSPQSLGAKE